MFPPETTFGAIYIIRNPLDISISQSNHSAIDIDQSVSNLTDRKFALSQKNGTLQLQLRQILGTWSDHVRSWKAAPIDVCFMRYEDRNNFV